MTGRSNAHTSQAMRRRSESQNGTMVLIIKLVEIRLLDGLNALLSHN